MRRALWLVGIVLASVAAGQDAVPPVKVHYVLDATDPKSGAATVEMTIQNNPDDDVAVAIPAWRPGSYRLLNYHTRIKDVTASAGAAELGVEELDRQTWKVKAAGKRDVTVRYRVTPDRGQIGADHYFVEGPGTYFYVVDRKQAACTVRFKLPDGWKAGSGLADLGDGIFGARDYDTFADCPTELGTFEQHSFKVDGATYELVVHAQGKWDSKRLIEAIRKIVKKQCEMFGGPPFDRYVFIYHFRDQAGGGGLEHLNSTDIAYPFSLVRHDPTSPASITSHEFFHLWNVKRIRPKELGPFDYARPVRSKALWLCEGVTSYYGDLTLARTGIWPEKRYLDHLADEVNALQNNPLRLTLSIEESSRTVWDRGRGDRYLDYYNKGELLGWILDMKIRAATGNAKSFDDVMRHLWQTYVVGPSKDGKGPIGVGFPEDGILKAINDVSGKDFSDFYRKHVSGTEDLPYKEAAEAAGLALDLRVDRTAELASWLVGAVVGTVPAGSADEKAGLKTGDRVIEVARKKVTGSTARAEIAKLKAGEEADFKVRRGEKEVDLKLTPVARERTRASLSRKADASEGEKKLFESWLHKETY